ncbi:MAG: hypothetical protein GX592_11945 [Clostridiales bacterium]|nr:hypothetical protein [Clostridiales bacterium]
MKTAGWFGVIVAVALIIVAIALSVPEDKFHGSARKDNVSSYFNGDAYNYAIEAGFRGGRIAGMMATKAAAGFGGAVLLAISFMALGYVADAAERDEERDRRHKELLKLLEKAPESQE